MEEHEAHTHHAEHGEHEAHAHPEHEHHHEAHAEHEAHAHPEHAHHAEAHAEHGGPAPHHEHHAGPAQRKAIEEQYLQYALAAALIIVIVSAFFAINNIGKAVDDLRNATARLTASPTPFQTRTPAPTPTPVQLANVTIIELVYPNCSECFNVSIISEQFQQAGDQIGMRVVAVRRLEANSTEGMALIRKYDITKVPTVIFSKEAQQTQLMGVWSDSGTVEDDGSLVLREVYPPYVALANGTLMGMVNVTLILAPNCTSCYNASVHTNLLTVRYSVVIANETDYTYDSAQGMALIRKYNITAVPTILVSPELSIYPGMEGLWNQSLGTKESDGWFVFRTMYAMGNVTYFDLTTNSTALSNVTVNG